MAEGENMKLWLLRPAESGDFGDQWGPWDPWYDKAFGFVMRAATEEEARAMADAEAGDENVRPWQVDENRMQKNRTNPTRIPESWDHPWLHAELSTCVPLTDAGETGIVIRDFRSA